MTPKLATQALDLLADPVAIIDDDFTITYANPAMTALCGTEVVGRKCHEVHHRCPIPCGDSCREGKACVHRQVLAENRPVTVRHHHHRADGTVLPVAVTASPIPGAEDQPAAVLTVIRDLSCQEALERHLETTAARERQIAELARLLLTGGALEEIAGLVLEEALETTGSEAACVGAWDREQEIFRGVVRPRDGEPRPVARRNEELFHWLTECCQGLVVNDPSCWTAPLPMPSDHPQLSRFMVAPARVDERCIGVVAVADRDRPYDDDDLAVVERLADLYGLALLRQEQTGRIERAKQEWERTFDAISDVVTLQDPEMRIIRANRATGELFGLEPEEVVGKFCYQLFRGKDEPCPECPVAEVLGRGSHVQAEVVHENLGRTFLVNLSPIVDESGGITGFAHFARDITEHKQLENQLQQAQKLEAIGRLAGGVAHDFNNLLTVIHGFLGLALAELPARSPAREHLARVQDSARRATDLVRQLLVFSRRQPMESQPIDCNRAVTDLLKMLRRLIGEDIRVETELNAAPATVLGDPTSLDQIVMNLAVNARDAMPKGGVLTIATDTFTPDVTYCQAHPEAGPGSYLRLTVADSGIGMDNATLQHIFEPFFTTKGDHGTGLGLSVVYGIVKKHGGWITCDSTPGRGTAFHVHLPLAPAAGEETVANTAAPATAAKPYRVLLVEDEANIRAYMERVLTDHGYRVWTSATVAEGRHRLAREDFDLLFTDLVLPDGSGCDLALAAGRLTPAPAVLLTSGYPEHETHRPLLEEYRWPLLPKPFDRDGLLAAVHRVLATHDRRD